MKKIQKTVCLALILFSLILLAPGAWAQRQLEKLGRSVVAMAQSNGSVYVGWRLLGTDSDSIAFNLYRVTNGGTPALLASNITATTDYLDTTANLNATNAYYVCPVLKGVEQAPSTAFTLYPNPSTNPYIKIPFQFQPGDQSPETCEVWPADVDGDGEYEFVVRWAHSPYIDAGNTTAATDTYKVEVYRLDGTKLPWRADLGWNVMTGLEISPAACYDLDGDGKAEFICMTAEGTTDGTGVTIGDTNGDGITDYRDSNGIVTSGPRFLSVFSCQTGKELARAPWPDRIGSFSEYGRNNIGIAYLDGVHPSIIVESAHDHTVIQAWNYSNGQLTQLWNWAVGTNDQYRLKGSHMSHIADVNGDGKDDILIGTLALKSDGTVLWVKPEGHGDYFYVGDLDPDRPGLEMVGGYETAGPRGFQAFAAESGTPLWSVPTSDDSGNCGVAPLISTMRGYQCWGGAGSFGGFFDIKGNLLNTNPWPSSNNLWWDADFCREISDNGVISTYSGTALTSRPYNHAGWADLLGDWREEEIDWDTTGLYIFTTSIPATNRMYTLMHDPQYRLAVAMLQQRKLPPLLPSFYIGPGMTSAPLPPVSDAQLVWTGGNNGNVWDTNLTANWHSNPYWSNDPTLVNFTSGSTVLFDLSGTNTVPVVLSGTLTPGQVTVNSPTDYNFTGAGKLSGTTRLLKGGHGTLVISNTTSHTGSTLVTEGALQVNGKYSSPCTVQAGGPWGPAQASGTGLFNGGIIFQAGGGISPGAGPNSPGILKVNNYCSFRGNTTSHFDLSNDPTGTIALNDQVQVTGNVFLSNTNNTFVFHRVGSAIASGTYKLITCTGTLSGNASTLKASGLDGIPYSLAVYPGAAGQITLEVRPTRAPGSVIWSGSGGSVWDLATTTNWSNGGVQDYFVGYDNVQFDDSGAANSTITLNDSMPVGGITVTGTSHYTFQGAGLISGTGGLIKSGSGTLSLFTLNTYTGSTVVTGGVLEVNRIANGGLASSIGAASSDPANLVLNDGCTLRLAGLASVSGDRGLTLNSGTCIIDVPNASSDLAFLGNCVGAGALLKTGSGMLVLRTDIGGEANNSYSGGTSIAGGTLQISDDSNLGAAGTPVTLSNGATLDIQWATDFVSRPLILQTGGGTLNARTSATLNSITGTGRLTLDGALRGVFTMSGSTTYSGGTTLVDGAAWVSNPAAMGTGSVTVSNGAELRFVPGGTSFANNISIAGDGVATQSTSAALFINGTSTVLSGSVSVTGDASITCANTNGLNFTFNGPIGLSSHTLSFVPGLASTSNSVKWTVNGVIGGTGDIVWNTISPGSTLVLTAANTFSGDTYNSGAAGLVLSNTLALQNSWLHYDSGSLKFGNGIQSTVLGALSGTQGLSLVNTSGTAVSLSVGNNNLSTTFGGVLSQAGGLVKVGTGTLTLTATSTYSGATTVSSGVLTVAGAITSSSALNVASGATLNLAGGSVTAATGTIASGGTLCGSGTIGGPLTNNGLIRVDGTMTFSGALVNSGTISVPYGTTLVLNGPVTNSGLVDASSGGTVVINSTWSGNPVQSSPPPVTYTTSSAGLWTTASWSPSQPVSGIGNTIVFNNAVAISSTNDLGSMRLNSLSLSNQAVTLAGSALEFSGSNPSLVAPNNYAHRISNNLILDQATNFVISSSSNATLSGTLQGAGGVIKSGSGTLILTATNTYSGGTVIAGGTVSITSAANLGASGADLTISNGAALKVSTNSVTLNSSDVYLQSGGGSIVNSSALTLNGIISGSGGLTKTSTGILTLSGTVPNTYTGATVINGPVYFAASGAFGTGTVTISSGNQLTFRPNGATLSNNLNIAGTGGGNGVLYLNGGTDVTLSGTVSLTAASTIGGANSAGMDLNMKALNLNSYGLTIKMGAAAGTTTQNWSIQGPITGTGNLTITCGAVSGTPSNTMNISGSNSFTGVTTLGVPAYGTLTLNINSVNALMNSTLDTGTNGAQTVAFTLSGSNTYNLGGLRGSNALAIGANTLSIGANGANTTFSGAVTGIGGITKVGAGSLTLGGSQQNTGNTTVSQGILYLNGSSISPLFSIQSSGTLRGSGTISGDLQIQGCLAPGNASGATTLAANSVSFLPGGVYSVQLNGANGTANSVQVSGNLTLDSTAVLSASYSGTSAPVAGTKFVIATYQGTWNGVPFSGMADDSTITVSGYSFVINYNDAGAVTLTAASGGMSPMMAKLAPTRTSSATLLPKVAPSRTKGNTSGIGGQPSGDRWGNHGGFANNSDSTQQSPLPLVFTGNHNIAGQYVPTLTFAAQSGAVFEAFGAHQMANVNGNVYSVEGSVNLSDWDAVAVEQLSPEIAAEIQKDLGPSLPMLDLGWSWYSFRLQEGVKGGFLRLRINPH